MVNLYRNPTKIIQNGKSSPMFFLGLRPGAEVRLGSDALGAAGAGAGAEVGQERGGKPAGSLENHRKTIGKP